MFVWHGALPLDRASNRQNNGCRFVGCHHHGPSAFGQYCFFWHVLFSCQSHCGSSYSSCTWGVDSHAMYSEYDSTMDAG